MANRKREITGSAAYCPILSVGVTCRDASLAGICMYQMLAFFFGESPSYFLPKLSHHRQLRRRGLTSPCPAPDLLSRYLTGSFWLGQSYSRTLSGKILSLQRAVLHSRSWICLRRKDLSAAGWEASEENCKLSPDENSSSYTHAMNKSTGNASVLAQRVLESMLAV